MTEHQANMIICQLSAIVDLLARQQGLEIEWDEARHQYVAARGYRYPQVSGMGPLRFGQALASATKDEHGGS